MSSRRRVVSLCSTFFFVSLAAIAQVKAPPAAGNVAPDTVVARQGSAVVTIADIDAFAQKIDDKQRAGFFDSPKRLDSLITNMLLQQQLAAEARQTGLDKDAVVKTQLKMADDDVLAAARMRAVRDDIKFPDFNKLAREEYIGHKEKYVTPGKLEVKHILISTDKHSEPEAKTIADDVRKQAAAHPDQFDALVDKYSEDPSKDKNHGLMEEAGDNKKYVAPFAAAASALKVPGEISEPVKTKFGYHILKLVTRTSDVPLKYEDVKPQIVEQLRSAYIEKTVTGHTDALRNQPLDANADVVASLRTRYGSRPNVPDGETAAPKDAAAPSH